MGRRIGFIGVGAMGKPMAERLLQAGFEVTVCPHRNPRPIDALAAQGARAVKDPAEVAAAAGTVITMVLDAPQVEEVCFGERGIVTGGMAAEGNARTLIDMSTISPAATKAVAARLIEHGIEMIDAPVSGGPARAATGELAIMVGGDAGVVARNRDVLETMGTNVMHVGPTGHGEIAKLTNNAIIGVLMPALGEALTFAAKSGADMVKIREVLLASSGGNWLLDEWLPRNMLQDRYEGGFALELMQKDIGAVLKAARESGVPMPIAGKAYELFEQAKGLGYGREDFSAVSKICQEAANVTIATGRMRH